MFPIITSLDQTYNIVEVHNFLPVEACKYIIDRASKQAQQKSLLAEPKTDVRNPNIRNSEETSIGDNDPIVADISDRLVDITGVPRSHQEMDRIIHYKEGGQYLPHFDSPKDDERRTRMFGDSIGRLITVIIYLNDVAEGGETIFPNSNQFVKPEAGKAVIFQNILPDGQVIDTSFHGGAPVKKGEKWIMTKWIRVNKV